MKLEDYFDFISDGDIRLKGHRIGIDDVLYYYLEGYSPEEIIVHLPSLSLEKIYATENISPKMKTALLRLSAESERS